MDKLQSLLMVLSDMAAPYHPDKVTVVLHNRELHLGSVALQPDGLCTTLAAISDTGEIKMITAFSCDFDDVTKPRVLDHSHFTETYCHDDDSAEDLLREGTEIFKKLTSPGFESGGESKAAIQSWLAL